MQACACLSSWKACDEFIMGLCSLSFAYLAWGMSRPAAALTRLLRHFRPGTWHSRWLG